MSLFGLNKRTIILLTLAREVLDKIIELESEQIRTANNTSESSKKLPELENKRPT